MSTPETVTEEAIVLQIDEIRSLKKKEYSYKFYHHLTGRLKDTPWSSGF
jgi:hypothetical protein